MKSIIPAAVLAICCLANSSNAIAEEKTTIADLRADLEAGRVDSAMARIKGIYLIAEPEKLVASGPDFVALVTHCASSIEETRTLGGNPIYRVSWICPAARYEAWLGRDPKGEKIEIWDVVNEEMISERASRGPIAPPKITLPKSPSAN